MLCVVFTAAGPEYYFYALDSQSVRAHGQLQQAPRTFQFGTSVPTRVELNQLLRTPCIVYGQHRQKDTKIINR
jgi:hypothetical protein